MYLVYLDESGDVGVRNSPSQYFVLSCIVVHESSWKSFLNDLIDFRRYLKKRYGILMKEEIHAAELLRSGKLKRAIPKNDRLDLLKKCLRFLNSRDDISIITVSCKKSGTNRDFFEVAWKFMIQRIDNTITYRNFPNSFGGDRCVLLSDNTDGGKLVRLLREMRRHNPVPNLGGVGYRPRPLSKVIEDPIFRNSETSYIHQMVDVVAFFARQYYEPNSAVRKFGAKNFYIRELTNVTNPHVTKNASAQNHIVEI